MVAAVISGDIIASTSLSIKGKEFVEHKLKQMLADFSKHYKAYSRVVKGDYIECVITDASLALRVALAIKCFVKSIPTEEEHFWRIDRRSKLFKEYGIRVAIGHGTLDRYEPLMGVADGEAIYHAGRTLSNEGTHSKERVVVKNTLFFASNDESLNQTFEPLLSLIDVLLQKATAKQCQVVYHKLLGKTEVELARLLSIAQSAVNQHSTSVGWNALDRAVEYYERTIRSNASNASNASKGYGYQL